MVCIGLNSGVKDGRRNLARVALALWRTPRISVFKLFDSNTGIYGINALHVLRDEAWVEKLTGAIGHVGELGVRPHIGKVFPAAQVADAHRFLETKQATGKVLLAWN